MMRDYYGPLSLWLRISILYKNSSVPVYAHILCLCVIFILLTCFHLLLLFFSFGFGLSYATFAYGDATVTSNTFSASSSISSSKSKYSSDNAMHVYNNDKKEKKNNAAVQFDVSVCSSVSISVEVVNEGPMDSDEVTQLYVQ